MQARQIDGSAPGWVVRPPAHNDVDDSASAPHMAGALHSAASGRRAYRFGDLERASLAARGGGPG
jgi:hypothetical protein